MHVARKSLAALATGIMAATAVTGLAATASAAAPAPRSESPSTGSPSAAAYCEWWGGIGMYCGYDLLNTYADYGDRGKKVKEIQALLRFHSVYVAVDGVFGKDTRAGVKKFQRSWGLAADGIVGPKTWQWLRTAV
ncbi:peptidoglycan-binding domain-containing protein [Streptomyces atriruber]|uniref:peptidoglycan-binding domain-containing protein n=1 Tax=Streptomyces atriruber TaxID=545121 RepID=UPI0006E2D045|nr:peptidoglycan-binding domain-containing protein [Streptomyces atriruber]